MSVLVDAALPGGSPRPDPARLAIALTRAATDPRAQTSALTLRDAMRADESDTV